MRGTSFLGAAFALALALGGTPAGGQTASPAILNTPARAASLLYPSGTIRIAIDPLAVRDDDFARNRDPALWSGMTVERITFRDGRALWAFWRIVNTDRPGGILWAVLHDNENGAFDAALRGVRRYGGVLIAVDTGADDDSYAARFNRAVTWGAPIDPNRNFTDLAPRYATALLADMQTGPRLIIALHTNAPGFDPGSSTCAVAPPGGSGGISIRVCNDQFRPTASRSRDWPFDDDDSMAIVPYGPTDDRGAAFCARALRAADYNIVFEHVRTSDGSLSNYALLHGLRYINFETRDRGNLPARRDDARARLSSMIDAAISRCLPGDQRPSIEQPVSVALIAASTKAALVDVLAMALVPAEPTAAANAAKPGPAP